MVHLISCILGPRLHRIYALVQGSDFDGLYSANALERFGNNVVRGINLAWNVGLYTSPLILSYLYQRNYFCLTGCVSLGKFATGLWIFLFVGMIIRGLGRATNSQYGTFLRVLNEAKQNPSSTDLKTALRRYDFDFWAWPTDFSVMGAKRNYDYHNLDLDRPLTSSGWWFLGLPCQCASWLCAHLFGRHLLFPGSIHLLQYALGTMLESGRQKLVTEHNGLRCKLEAQDENSIDTMFIDRRKGKIHPNGSTLVICCEGNAGFYEIGIMNTPLEVGYSVLGWNHPGFAGSSGAPFPSQELNAIDAVVQYAIHKLGFNVEDIIMYGWSIGGYAAAYAAMSYPEVRGLVLDATFDDVLPLALPRMPSWMGGLVRHTIRNYLNLNTAQYVTRYSGPITLVRRTQDEIITTIEGLISTNRGNDLMMKLLRSRFPSLFLGDQASTVLHKWVSEDRLNQEKIYQKWSIEPEFCLAQLVSYSTQKGEKFPMMIGEDWNDADRTKMLLYLANKYLINFESNHNTILDSSLFRAPWAPILDSSFVELE